jgi:hypothetical protein
MVSQRWSQAISIRLSRCSQNAATHMYVDGCTSVTDFAKYNTSSTVIKGSDGYMNSTLFLDPASGTTL